MVFRLFRHWLGCGALLFLSLSAVSRVRADEFEKIALSGEPQPFGGTYDTQITPLHLNSKGVTAYLGRASGYFPYGYLFWRTPTSATSAISRFTVPPEGGNLGDLVQFDTNSAGDIVFRSDSDHGTNLYLVSDRLHGIVAAGEVAPEDGNFGDFAFDASQPAINEARQVAFSAVTTVSGKAVYIANPGVYSKDFTFIAKVGTKLPNGVKFTDFFPQVALTTPGAGAPTRVVFYAKTDDGINGLYMGSPGNFHLLRPGEEIDYRLNNKGDVVYVDGDLYRTSFDSSTAVVHQGDPAPGGGTLYSLRDPSINDRGEIAFAAWVDQPSGPDTFGLFVRTADGVLKTVATGAAPGGGNFSSFDYWEINQNGLVMFVAGVDRNDDTSHGIYLGDGQDTVKVSKSGDLLLGTTIKLESFHDVGPIPAVPDYYRNILQPGHGSFNASGQVAFRVNLTVGDIDRAGIFLASPSVHWRKPGGGDWSPAANWSFSVPPAPLLNVNIDVATDLVVTGPSAPATVKSLTIGGAAGQATLALQPAGPITATNGVTVAANGILGGTGKIGSKVTFNPGSAVALTLGANGHDSLTFTGPVALDGTLRVTAAAGAALKLGTFKLFTFKSLSGQFGAFELPPLPSAALTWDQSQLYTKGLLAAALTAPLRGTYEGRIAGTRPETNGPISLDVHPDASFHARGTLGGKKFSFSGAFDDSGAFTSEAVDDAGDKILLQLDLAHPDAGALTGTLMSAAAQTLATVTAQQTPTYSKKAPSPFAGAYTLALPRDPAHSEPAYPQGTGYATLTVSAAGLAKLVGVLGDGTPFTAGGSISAQGELAVYAGLYHKLGFLTGQLVPAGPKATQELTGTLHWSRPGDNNAGDITVEGSGFEPAPHAPLDLTNGGTLTVSDGHLATPVAPADFTVDPAHANRVTFAAAGPTLKFSKSTITGSFPTTIAGKAKAVKFTGVVLQKQNIARGLFTGDGETGSVSVQPKAP